MPIMSDSESYSSESSDSADEDFVCNYCGKQCSSIDAVSKHTAICPKRLRRELKLTCKWCNMKFKNRGNLVTHAFHLHGDSSYKSLSTKKFTKKRECTICNQTFVNLWHLKFHIRAMHFNLKGKIPYAELKKVDQVWFEKVLNSKYIIEIRKTSPNTLVMRKLEENASIKVNSDSGTIVDLSHLYPLSIRSLRVQCKLCKQLYFQPDMKKHVNEVHLKNVKQRCNNCNRCFTRYALYIKHICSKKPKLKGVFQGSTNMVITRVESLKKTSEPPM